MEFIFLTLVIFKGWVEKGSMSHFSMSQDYHKNNEKLFPSTAMEKKE